MRVGKTLLLTTAATVFAWGSASAADIYVPPVEPAPYIAPEKEWDWTGIHVGIDAGGQFDFVDSFAGLDFFAGGKSDIELLDEADLGAQNWFISGDVGADYQVGDSFVIGIFANYDWSPSDGSASHSAFLDDDEDCNVCEVGNTVTYGDAWGVGGRAGFLINPKTLVYGLGGYGMKQINAESFFVIEDGSLVEGGLTGGGWQPGWFVGGGIEAAVGTHATVALEYRYAQYNGFSAFCEGDDCTDDTPPLSLEHGFDVGNTASHTIRARLSVWFN